MRSARCSSTKASRNSPPTGTRSSSSSPAMRSPACSCLISGPSSPTKSEHAGDFITGNEVSGVFVLDQWAEFAHQKRNMVGVTADTRSTHNLLIKLEQFGHRLLAHFHSHPGKGPDSTHPSGIDENFQKRLESAGHVAVMAIRSEEGFIRFVRMDQDVDIEIYGQGVEQHAPGIYRLKNLD